MHNIPHPHLQPWAEGPLLTLSCLEISLTRVVWTYCSFKNNFQINHKFLHWPLKACSQVLASLVTIRPTIVLPLYIWHETITILKCFYPDLVHKLLTRWQWDMTSVTTHGASLVARLQLELTVEAKHAERWHIMSRQGNLTTPPAPHHAWGSHVHLSPCTAVWQAPLLHTSLSHQHPASGWYSAWNCTSSQLRVPCRVS